MLGRILIIGFFLPALTAATLVLGVSSVQAGALREVPSDSLGPTIDTIVVDNRNVYDTDDSKFDNFLFRLANRIHITTRESVIRRELLFEAGEPYPYQLAEESARNLRTRLPLYDAWIELDTLSNGHLRVTVVTIDEWTLAFGPNIQREGNEYRYDFSASDRNLFGRNQELSLSYVVQESEDNFADVRYENQRLWARPYRLVAGYRNDPRDGREFLSLGHPFYNLRQDFAYNFSINATSGRRDIYRDSRRIAESQREGDWFQVLAMTRTGTYQRKLRLSGIYEYRYENTFDETYLTDDPDDIALAERTFALDSVYHYVEMGLAVSNFHFTTARRVDGFSYTEDFTLGQQVSASYGRAFLPGFDNHVFDLAKFEIGQGYRFGPNLFFARYERRFWYRGSTDIRRTSTIEARLYGLWARYLTVAMRGQFVRDWRSDGAEGLVLGGESALRGYEKFFLTGDRVAFANIEARFFPDVAIHSAVFSPVVFADVGQVWKSGEDIAFDQVYGAMGIGLRVGLEHSARGRLLRLDVSYSEKNSWQVSISTDQFFNAPANSLLLTSP